MSENQPKYKRILLKLSGEALAGDKKMGLDMPTVTEICKSIKKCYDVGAEIGIVVGGGNYWRGRSSENMDRVRTHLQLPMYLKVSAVRFVCRLPLI